MIVLPTYKVSMTKCLGALNKPYCYNVKIPKQLLCFQFFHYFI